MKHKFIGSRAFYKTVLLMVVPMVIQQGITNFVSLIDNIMVGRLGTEALSGVAIINQLMFVFNISIFGGTAGASILGAQFYGQGDNDGVRFTFRFKCIISIVMFAAAIGIFLGFGSNLIQLYLTEGTENVGDIALTFEYSKSYLQVMLLGLLPFVISQCYSSTLRDSGETVIPMIGSLIAVVLNVILNSILIFGLLGAPKLGVTGAAIATVISRYAEMFYMIIKSHCNTKRFPFFHKAIASLYIPWSITKKILLTSWPLMINEFLWSLGQATLTRNYSLRGLVVMGAFSISSTVSNLFFVVCIGMGSVISILVGQLLGAGKIEEARDTDRKLLFFNVMIHLVIALVLISVARFIPRIYKADESVKSLATSLLYIYALALPLNAFNHGAYFTMRSGGKTFITFLFDSVATWVVSIPVAYVLINYSTLNIVLIYFIVSYADIVKAFIGFFMVKSGVWAKKIVHQEEEVQTEWN